MFLQISADGGFQLALASMVGESVALLGIKGSGKTNTAAVLIEELLLNNFPMTIVDIEGEYWGLKEKFDILVVGRSSHVDVEMGAAQAAELARISFSRGISVILDMSEFSQDEMFEFLLCYFTALWESASAEGKPYQVVLEEAHEFIPQSARTPLKEILTRIALRGRKRGLGLISISQRSAKVDKDVLTQAALVFLHRVVHPVDLKVYQDIVPLPPKEVEAMVRQLEKGQAIVLHNYETQVVKIRLRHTFHAGATPDFATAAAPELRKIDESVLEELRSLIQHPAAPSNDETGKLRQQIADNQQLIEAQAARIVELEEQVELLSKLEVRMGDGAVQVEQHPVEVIQVAKTDLSPDADAPYRTELAVKRAKNRQERQFQNLLDAISRIPKLRMNIEILGFLHQNSERTFSAANILPKIGYSSSTGGFAPGALIKLGLISKDTIRNGYRARMTEELQSRFPDLDVEDMVDQILALAN